jgi:hypothetical protein
MKLLKIQDLSCNKKFIRSEKNLLIVFCRGRVWYINFFGNSEFC